MSNAEKIMVELTIDQAENLRRCIDSIAQQTFGNVGYGGFKFTTAGWRNAALADAALSEAISAASADEDGS